MSSDNLTDLRGQIERITYINEENSYTVVKVKVYGRKDLVTVIGNIVNPTPGEIISMKGEWGNHSKYGEQFKIVFCQCTTRSEKAPSRKLMPVRASAAHPARRIRVRASRTG